MLTTRQVKMFAILHALKDMGYSDEEILKAVLKMKKHNDKVKEV